MTVLLMLWRREASSNPDDKHSLDPFDGIEFHSAQESEDKANEAIDIAEAKWRAEHNGAEPDWKWLMESVFKEQGTFDPKAKPQPEPVIEGEAVEDTELPAEVEDDPPVTEQAVQFCEYSAAHKMNGRRATTTIDCGPVGVVPACQECADFYERQGG